MLRRMPRYGQFCPIARAANVLCERWTPLILREFMLGSTRFNDLQRGVPLMSPSLLSKRLKQLEVEGIIERRPGDGGRGVHYRLTEAGRNLEPIIMMMGNWAQEWSERGLRIDELDVNLLVWDMQRTVKPDQFPPGRTTVELEFTDLPATRARWWFVCDSNEVELCPVDPGFDVSLYVTTDLRTMSEIWIGHKRVEDAIDAGSLDLHGTAALRQRFGTWLRMSPFAVVPSRRATVA